MPLTIQVTLGDDALAAIAAAVGSATLQGMGTVVADFPTQPAPGTPQATPGQQYAAPAGQPVTGPPSSDPWAGQQQVPTAPNAGWGQPAPVASSAPPVAPPSNPGYPTQAQQVKNDRFGNSFLLGRPDAPLCTHGQPSVLKSGTSKAGKPYSGWVCGQHPDNYKAACEFYQKVS